VRSVVGTRFDAYGETRRVRADPHGSDPRPTVALRENDDSIVLVLADGVGSWEDGVEGSREGAQLLADALAGVHAANEIAQAFANAAAALDRWNRARGKKSELGEGPADVGHSIVAACVSRERILLAGLGGARGFVIRAGAVMATTHDDSLAAEFVRTGKATPEEIAQTDIGNIQMRFFQAMSLATYRDAPDDRNTPRVTDLEAMTGDLVVLASGEIARSTLSRGIVVVAPHAERVVRTLLAAVEVRYESSVIAVRI